MTHRLSILLRQRDGENALGLCGIGGVLRPGRQRIVVIVDLPEQPLPGDLECAEIMLAVGIVVGREVAECFHGGESCGRKRDTQVRDARREKAPSSFERGAESVVEVADALGSGIG